VPTVKPVFENRKETAEAFGVVVQLPGVAKDGLELTLEDGLVRILGRRTTTVPAGWTPLYRETTDAAYEYCCRTTTPSTPTRSSPSFAMACSCSHCRKPKR